ncbi:Do family serine endopeptidase [Actimicrobium sp. CCC2.4]|uniref:Do family serine endopeptidase n=1 Tax=Actimicrobium sp. CCC2.4 TaxID=3048606 RepID=UPI002AC8C703|nr:Do family serine endopeptidase [Actimicrobium sp. CCC2.4]MEB0136400.1 Do family serine endopeptidase [Actimicrobium sp. CCC2.4]WPX31219.1 Do family serine endopeptidase [Actimicrobium sp. CCC2.4]
MKPKNIVRTAIASGVFAALVSAYAGFGIGHSDPAHATTAAVSVAVPVMPGPVTNFSGIVDRYGPAVVNISVTGSGHQVALADQSDDGQAPDLSQFFRGFQAPRSAETEPVHALGSGFIINASGLILTNAHVVEGAREVVVKLTDRREFKAKVLGADRLSDVAVLQIDATDLPVVKFGNPSATRVGDPVLAIGSPYGFENTATSGIISAKARSLPDGSYVPFLQTDVALNPGNSGGPLFNLQGEVIGMNSQIYSRTGGYQGLSFAIPIDVASNVERQLATTGKVSRGHLGIAVQELNPALVESFGLKSVHGALVSSVDKKGPAGRAGLQSGDVITRVDDHDVNYSSDLPVQIALMKPGTAAKLAVLRKGQSLSVDVTIGAMNDKQVAMTQEAAPSSGKLGVMVRELAGDAQRQAGVASGVLVEQVSGAAARAGIEPGDVIVAVNGAAVTSGEQLQQMVAKSGKKMALLVQRDDVRIFVPVDLG